jgi:hypothetical protein
MRTIGSVIVRLTHDHVNGYHEQLQQIFAEHNQTWQQIRAEEEK